MDAAAIHDPNIDYLYLNDMIGPEHPMYEEMKRRYASTPEGKRIEQFRKDNVKYGDALQVATHGKIDNFIRSENVEYTGDPTDRIAKITAIRLARSQKEEEQIKRMTTEERKAYLYEAKKKRAEDAKRAAARLLVDQDSIVRRNVKKQANMTALQEFQYKRDSERRAQQEKNRQFLKDDLERRRGVAPNPVEAREAALKEREQKEKELADAAEANDAAAAKEQEQLKKESAIKAPAATDQAAKKQAAVTDRKAARQAELSAMNKGKLDELMTTGGLKIAIGMTNAQKATAILDAEYPIK